MAASAGEAGELGADKLGADSEFEGELIKAGDAAVDADAGVDEDAKIGGEDGAFACTEAAEDEYTRGACEATAASPLRLLAPSPRPY